MRSLVCAAALAAFALCLTAGPASAATFTVTTTADAPDNFLMDGVCNAGGTASIGCTLRAAVQQANFSTGSDPDTINVPAGTFNLTQPVPTSGPDDSGGDLDITGPTTINGAGARSTVVDQRVADRVFQVSSNPVTLQGLAIEGGALGSGSGTGIFNSGTLNVVNSAVRFNTVGGDGGGIYNATGGTLVVDHSLLAGNEARGGLGGGIFSAGSSAQLINSTVSSNTADDGSGVAAQFINGSLNVQYSTISGNASVTGAALSNAGASQVRDSIVASNGGTGLDCSGSVSSAGYNIESGVSCKFGAIGDKQNTNPQLGPLVNNGGPTDTHLPAGSSPAVDSGNPSGCPASDQRGFARPIGPVCDIGAVEQTVPPAPPQRTPASLVIEPGTAIRTPGDPNTVTATVKNNDGSPAAGVSVRYAISGPNDGAGAVTTGADGTAQISWEGVHEGTDSLTAYVDTNGDLTPESSEPTGAATVTWALPAPTQGRTANIEPVSGTVRITVKSGSGKVGPAGASSVLKEAQQVPLTTTVVDTRRGRVRMTTAADKKGNIQKGEFYGGVYSMTQSPNSRRPVTELRMTESLICQRSSRSRELVPARARRRHLWGNARGRFRTRGRNSTATVRGTIWLQKDSCNATTTVVRQGRVTVRDLVKRKNVTVKAGKRYTARRR